MNKTDNKYPEWIEEELRLFGQRQHIQTIDVCEAVMLHIASAIQPQKSNKDNKKTFWLNLSRITAAACAAALILTFVPLKRSPLPPASAEKSQLPNRVTSIYDKCTYPNYERSNDPICVDNITFFLY